MPIITIYGGQFGDEGKGKLAEATANKYNAIAVVRVGGSQADHTGLSGVTYNVLPTCAGKRISVLPVGSYITLKRLRAEMKGIPPDMLLIDNFAGVITRGDKAESHKSGRIQNIGSHGLGVRSAVERRKDRKQMMGGMMQCHHGMFAYQYQCLQPYLCEVDKWLHYQLDKGEYIIIEGTQGFGLSNHLTDMYPYVTSRTITPDAFLSEAGVSSKYVEERIMCLRTFPIRVAGNSGPLPFEISWDIVTQESGSSIPICECPKNTGNIHRVARFDKDIVCRAIKETNPTRIVLNMIDYVDIRCNKGIITDYAEAFISNVEKSINREIDLIGFSKNGILDRNTKKEI